MPELVEQPTKSNSVRCIGFRATRSVLDKKLRAPGRSFGRGSVVFATARYARFVAHFFLLGPFHLHFGSVPSLPLSLLLDLRASKSRYSLYIFRALVKLFYLPYPRSHAHRYFSFILTCYWSLSFLSCLFLIFFRAPVSPLSLYITLYTLRLQHVINLLTN